MTSVWEKFEAALKGKGKSIDDFIGITREEKIEELIKACGINDIFDVGEVLTNFKKRQGKITKRAKIAIEDVDVGFVSPVDAEGQWIDTKHMMHSGLAESKRIYIRKDCLNLWKFLDSNRNCYVRGSPGTGKSTIAWQWCLYTASQGASIRWIHYDRDKTCQTVEFKDGKFRVVCDIFDDYQTQASIFVLDGIYPDIANQMAYYLLEFRSNKKIKLVFVSSLTSDWRGPEYERYSPELYTMSGWTLDEYKSACKDDSFRAIVEPKLDANPLCSTIEDKIEAKFDIAGHSARWMFNFDTRLAIQQADSAIERTHLKKEILEGLAGSEAKYMVHNLFSSFENGTKKVIVSPFVVRKLSTRWDLKFIAKLTTWGIKEGNNSLLGWIFQADFLARIQAKLDLTFVEAENWDISSNKTFYKVNEIGPGDLKEGIWLIPTKINQGCYVCLQIFPKDGIVRSVQLTVSDHHSAKLQYLGEALNHLVKVGFVVTKIDMVFVVPIGVDFHLPPTSVTLNPTVSATGWKIGNERSLHFLRANEISNTPMKVSNTPVKV